MHMLPAGIPVGATVHYILHRAKSKKQKAKAAAIYKGHRVKYAWGQFAANGCVLLASFAVQHV
jgi:hypothetical protein